MINNDTFLKLESLVKSIAEREGCLLYDLEFAGSGFGGRALRVYIDREDGLVSIDDCANVSRALNLVLDVEDIVPGGAYNLEVSTPGLDRVLRKTWHFEKAVGKKIWVKLAKPLKSFGLQNKALLSAKQVQEVLKAADDKSVTFELAGEDVSIPYADIEKAKLVFEIEKGEKKKPGKNKK